MRLSVASALLAACLLGGCASARSAAPSAELPPDSAALLRQALQRVRPAYPTQEAAIRAGVYARRDDSAPGQGRQMRAESATSPPAALPPEHPYVIQIAAFRDEASAQVAADDVRRHFPLLSPLIEPADGWYRVALAGWPDEIAAGRALSSIRSLYPSAWIRTRALP